MITVVDGDHQRAARSGTDVPGGMAWFGPLRVILKDTTPTRSPARPFSSRPANTPSSMAVQLDPSGGSPVVVITGHDGIALLNRMPGGHGVACYYASGSFTVTASVAGGKAATLSLTVTG